MGSNLGTAYGRIVVDGSGAAKGFAVAGRGATGFAKASKVAFAGVAAAGVGFGAALASAVKTAASFEQQLANLKSVARPTGQEFDALREQALKLGADTKFSAQEAALGQTELAKAGLSTADILGGGLQGALSLAAAGDLELADAAAIAANAMNLFSIEGDKVESVADALATAANVTTGDVADFGQALTQGGAAAKLAGLDMTQTVSILEALADAGVKGSDAGTSMKASLLQLLNPTAKQSKLAKELGINWLDQNGALKDAAGLSGELQRATAGMTKAERTKTLAVLAGTDGLRTLAALYEAGPAGMRAYERGLQQTGTAAETARIRQGTLEGQLEQLGGAIDTIKIRIGSALIPGLTAAATATADWLSTLGDSDGLESFADGLVSGFAQAFAAAQEFWASVQPLVMQLGTILADAFIGFVAAAQGAAPVLQTLVQAFTAVAGAALAIIGPMVSLAGALAGIPGVAQAAGSALVGIAAGMIALRAASAAGGAVAFVQLAGTIRSVADAAALGGATFPRLAAGLATLASPAGIAAAGIGLVAGGVALLASGAFAGTNSAQRLADALNNIKTAADAAKDALSTFTGSVEVMKDAHLRAKTAAAAVTVAEENLARVRKDPGASPGQIAQAEAGLASARREAAKANREVATSQREVSTAAVKGVVDLARLTTEITRGKTVTDEQATAMQHLGQRLGISDEATAKMVAQQRKLANQGATTGDRMNALRRSIADAARDMDTSTKSGREAARVLTVLGSVDGKGLMTFAERVQTLEREGVPAAQALDIALTEAAQDREVQLTAKDHASEVADGVKRAFATLRDAEVRINATTNAHEVAASAQAAVDSVQDSVVRITTIFQGKHPKGSPRVFEMLGMLDKEPKQRTFDASFRPRGTGAMEMALNVARAFDRILEAREKLDAQLAGIDAREEARAQRLERARLAREVRSTARKLANAKADEKAAARSASNQAKAAMAEFDRQARLEARRRPLQLKLDRIDLAESAMSDLESALSDAGSRITDALQRSFDSTLSGLDAALESSMDGIDRTLAGSLAYVDAHLQAMIAQIDAGLRSTMAAIESSAEAMRVKAIDAATEAAQLARQQRDDARKLAEFQASAGAADARVSRLQGVLSGARTDSERQAAQALLDAALKDQVAAAEALADFQEDQQLASLAREKEFLEAGLQQRREAAEADAQAERDHWTAWAEGERTAAEERARIDREAAQIVYDQRRAAAEAEFVARQTEVQRELGDLREQLRAGEITHTQFLKRLQAIYEDPAISKALTDSGQTLGLDFARGLDRSQKQVEKSAKALAGIVKKYLKLNSPAESGPLAYDPEEPGRIIGASLAAGMASQRRAVEAMARQLAEAAAMTIPASTWSALEAERRGVGPGSWAGGGRTVTHNNQRHVTQTVNQTIGNQADAREMARQLEWLAQTSGGRF